MVKPIISDEEFNELKERFMASLKEDWAKTFTPALFSSIGTNIPVLIEITNLLRLKESSERLEKSSRTLNRQTGLLIALTTVLAILTAVSVWRFH